MILTPIEMDFNEYPEEFRPFLKGAKLYDSSCSKEAKVIFIDKDQGYFLKSAPKEKLEREALMTRYFHKKALGPQVISYLSCEKDWLLTEKITGEDCIAQKYLEQPNRLCDIIAERLAMLHSEDFSDCPVQNLCQEYLKNAKLNKLSGSFDKSHFPDSFGYENPEDAWNIVENYGHLLKTDALLHGDYCLPNIILDNWRFSGFIDIDGGGAGNRHRDIFSAIWSLWFNLKTDKYRQRFIDAYGRSKVDEEILRVIAAVEVFG